MRTTLNFKFFFKCIFVFISIGSYVQIANAVTLNFSAILTDSTCSISLDKNVLSLGDITQSRLRPNQLLSTKPFRLNIQNCTPIGVGSAYSIRVSGNGETQDGRWLFKNSSTATNGAGIMIIKSDTAPDYSKTEIQDGTIIALADPGVTPVDQFLTFYAGVSCGGNSGCATVTPGAISATVIFDLIYR